jgi:hypothetical protein
MPHCQNVQYAKKWKNINLSTYLSTQRSIRYNNAIRLNSRETEKDSAFPSIIYIKVMLTYLVPA